MECFPRLVWHRAYGELPRTNFSFRNLNESFNDAIHFSWNQTFRKGNAKLNVELEILKKIEIEKKVEKKNEKWNRDHLEFLFELHRILLGRFRYYITLEKHNSQAKYLTTIDRLKRIIITHPKRKHASKITKSYNHQRYEKKELVKIFLLKL